MQLVDEGLVDLDRAGAHLPAGVPHRRRGRRGGDHHAPAAQPHGRLRGRHLHRHRRRATTASRSTSPTLGDTPQLFPPGEQFSYNNAGYCVLGRLVEVLREKTYDDGLREHLIAPLGLTHAATSAVRGDHVPRRHGSRRGRARGGLQPAPVSGRWRGPTHRPARCCRCDRATWSPSPRCTSTDGRAADGTQVLARRHRRPDARAPGRAARLGLMGDVVGPGLRALRHPRAARSSATTAAPSGRPPSCGSCRTRASRWPCSPTAATCFSLYHDIVSHVLAELADSTLPPLPGAAGRAPSASTRGASSAPTPPRSST